MGQGSHVYILNDSSFFISNLNVITTESLSMTSTYIFEIVPAQFLTCFPPWIVDVFLHREVLLSSEAPHRAFGSPGSLWRTFLTLAVLAASARAPGSPSPPSGFDVGLPPSVAVARGRQGRP